ncbi:MAG: glycosyltransferase family 1 protein [Thermaerobacter sp.]|nr:glycosyltransferase family 1 protein [Thermaerobacter sp.]
MKIAMDVSGLAELRTGTEEYIEGLVWGLNRQGVSVVGMGRHGPLLPDQPGLGLPARPDPSLWRKWWWETVGVKRVPPAVELLHIPHLSHPASRLPVPSVVTVHDLIPWRLPSYRHRWRERAYFSQIKRTLPYATALVAISEATRGDIADFFPGLASKVTVIPNGVHLDFFLPVDVALMEAAHRRNGLRRHPRLLYVGGYDARKNVPTLIEAARRVFDRVKDGELVLVGAAGRAEVLRAAASAGIGDRAILTPFLSRREVVALYHAADVFVFPSRYEGFGLPPAQALAAGVPVVAGNTPAVAEVLRESAILVDAESGEAWVEAILRVLETPALAQKMAARGKIRAQDFSWEKVAEQYVTLYRRLAGGGREG